MPLVEVCRRLEKPGLPGIDAAMSPLFRDVSDHIRQVQEEIESLREVLSFAFETEPDDRPGAAERDHPQAGSLGGHPGACRRQWPGIYGMNFDVLPELHWKYGYPLCS